MLMNFRREFNPKSALPPNVFGEKCFHFLTLAEDRESVCPAEQQLLLLLYNLLVGKPGISFKRENVC